jgi:uncharacterized protein YndB with AHSA1/START domain
MTETTNELVITRVFDAPRELVYRAFVDPDELAQWFAPVGWSVPRDSISVDVRVGGREVFTMVNDDDPTQTSPVQAVFTEVVENKLLVATEDVDMSGGTSTERFSMRLEFYDEGDKTRIVLRQGPYSPDMKNNARDGWESSFTKLDALLAA